MAPLEHALAYAAIGWHVFPIERGTKRPIGRLTPRGHLDATTDEATIRRWWGEVPEAGIGVAVAASRLVVADVDPRNGGHFDLERIEAEHGPLLTDVLAFTGGGGQHLVFLAPTDTGRLPGKLAKGIDLKADGYIVVEPSMHPSGRSYEWEASSNPLEGAVPSPLPGWIADLARAPTGAAALPQATGAAGAARPLADHELAELRGALAMVPAVERETWVAVGMALHRDVGGALGFDLWSGWSQTCPEKFDPQDQARVWRSFTRRPMGEAVTLATIFDLAYKHGFRRPRTAVVTPELPPAGEPAPRVLNTVPEVVDGPSVAVKPMPVQGLNDLARWVFDGCAPAHVLVAQASALALACTAAGRRYVSTMGDPATAFFGLLTPTASQSRAALTAAERALIRCGLRRAVRSQRLGSAQQVFSAFIRSPSVLYTAADWGEQLAQAKRQPSGLLAIAHGVLAGSIYSCDDVALDNWSEIGLKRPESAPKNHLPTIYQPALTLLAGISEAQLRPMFRRQEIGRGTLDCMLLVPALGVDEWADRVTQAPAEVPAAARETLRRLAGADPADAGELQPVEVALVEAPTPVPVVFACDIAAADQRWIAHARELPPHLRSLSWGARRTTRRLCVAMAAFADPDRPIVTDAILVWCETFVRQCLAVTLQQLEVLGDEDDARADVGSYVLEILLRRGPEGCSASDLPKLCRPFRRLGLDDRGELLGRLLADEAVVDIPGARGKGTRYVARQFVVMRPNPAQPRDIGDIGDTPSPMSGPVLHR